MEYQTLLVEVGADKIATVTINRPKAMNSFNTPMLREFAQLWAALQNDDAVSVIVLRAAEGRAFSTGADVKASGDDAVVDYSRPFDQRDPGEFLGPKSNRCWKPVIGAVHGLCCAGAFYWVSECDFVICSDDAEFFDPHVTYGLVAAIEPIGLTYRIPYGEVMRMVLLGNDERMSAKTALRIGLVTEIVDGHEPLWQRAQQLAARIALKPAIALQGSVKAVWESQDLPRYAALAQSMKNPMLGNPIAQATLDRDALLASVKQFEVR
ncbi:MAG: enoyl-CoA hydratase [Hydrocarboniphaga sp.]|nr:enoyl-CoA hydratase [Hydrocarboniphaga sp.]